MLIIWSKRCAEVSECVDDRTPNTTAAAPATGFTSLSFSFHVFVCRFKHRKCEMLRVSRIIANHLSSEFAFRLALFFSLSLTLFFLLFEMRLSAWLKTHKIHAFQCNFTSRDPFYISKNALGLFKGIIALCVMFRRICVTLLIKTLCNCTRRSLAMAIYDIANSETRDERKVDPSMNASFRIIVSAVVVETCFLRLHSLRRFASLLPLYVCSFTYCILFFSARQPTSNDVLDLRSSRCV